MLSAISEMDPVLIAAAVIPAFTMTARSGASSVRALIKRSRAAGLPSASISTQELILATYPRMPSLKARR